MKNFTLLISSLLLTLISFSQVQFKYKKYAKYPSQSIVSNDGSTLYLSTEDDVQVFSINENTGNLTKIQTFVHSKSGDLSNISFMGNGGYIAATASIKSDEGVFSTMLILDVDMNSGKIKELHEIEFIDGNRIDYNSELIAVPKVNRIYLGDRSTQDLHTFKFDPNTGNVTKLMTFKTETPMLFNGAIVSEDGSMIYTSCSNSGKDIVSYSVDVISGEVNKYQEVEYPVNNDKFDMASKAVLSPDEKFVYLLTFNGNIIVFKRDLESGLLANLKYYEGGDLSIPSAHMIFIDGSGDFFYALHTFGDGDAMHVLKRNSSTGLLSYKKSFYDKGETTGLNGIFQLSFSKNGKYIFASGTQDHDLNVFYNLEGKERYDSNISYGFNENEEVSYENPTSTSISTGSSLSSKLLVKTHEEMTNASTESERLDVALQNLEGKNMSTIQVASLALLFKSEYKRMEFVKFARYFLSDPENFNNLLDLFTQEAYLQEFRN